MKTKAQIAAIVRGDLIDEKAAELIRRGVAPWRAHQEAADIVDVEAARRDARENGTVSIGDLVKSLERGLKKAKETE